MSDTVTIPCFSDNRANHLSVREDEMEIDRAAWEAMSQAQRDETVREYLVENEHFTWWFKDPLPPTERYQDAQGKEVTLLARRRAPYSVKAGETVPFVIHGKTVFAQVLDDLSFPADKIELVVYQGQVRAYAQRAATFAEAYRGVYEAD